MLAEKLQPKTITDPHIFARVSSECVGGMFTELNIYILHLVLDSYQYTELACVKIHALLNLNWTDCIWLRGYKGFLNLIS